jgi:hypothetical protein
MNVQLTREEIEALIDAIRAPEGWANDEPQEIAPLNDGGDLGLSRAARERCKGRSLVSSRRALSRGWRRHLRCLPASKAE